MKLKGYLLRSIFPTDGLLEESTNKLQTCWREVLLEDGVLHWGGQAVDVDCSCVSEGPSKSENLLMFLTNIDIDLDSISGQLSRTGDHSPLQPLAVLSARIEHRLPRVHTPQWSYVVAICRITNAHDLVRFDGPCCTGILC